MLLTLKLWLYFVWARWSLNGIKVIIHSNFLFLRNFHQLRDTNHSFIHGKGLESKASLI